MNSVGREKPLKLTEVASRIYAKLKLFAADPILSKRPNGHARFWTPNAYNSGRYVCVVYISYQGATSLVKADAIAYMEWLEAGNVGTHYEFEREKVKP